MRFGWIIAGAALAGCAAGEFMPQRVTEIRPTLERHPRGAMPLRAAMLAGHNAARAAAGLAPLAWDEGLVATAQAYATDLARTERFAHAEQPDGPAHQGENLWMGTRDAYRYQEMIGHWVAEKRDFLNRPTPGFSKTAHWQDVAHYTQIIWRHTTRMGCAMASSARDDYLVCRYSPAGNVVGQMPY